MPRRSARREEARETPREEAGERGEKVKKPYTYEFYHDIGKEGGEATKRKHGHESLEELRKESTE